MTNKVIDFDKKGNIVRFYTGKEDLDDWYGDDWDDSPYDCNAGSVYEEYVSGHVDVAFPYDTSVLEPADGCWNTSCPFCKDDMKSKDTPCIIAVPPEIAKDRWDCDIFSVFAGSENAIKFYFGDNNKTLKEKIKKSNGLVINEVEEE